MNNWQVQSSHRTAVKTSELVRQKTLFSFKIPIRDDRDDRKIFYLPSAVFRNKIIRSTLTLFVVNLGIDVIIIGVAQQGKPKFSHPCKILTELCNSPSKHIPFFQNADLRFLMNTVIRSILTLFTNCKHRHQYYIGIIQIFEFF